MSANIKIFQRIQQTLDEIKAILVLANQDKLEKAKKTLLKEDTIELQIYELCDGTRTTKDIAKEIHKSVGYVRSYISRLRRKGLIQTIELDGRTIHKQIF